MYIVLEGIVGSGKSTQVKKLVEYFTSPQPSPKGEGVSGISSPLWRRGDWGVRCIHVREPGSTPIAEDIRHLAQQKEWENEQMHPLTNAYLYAAARAQTLQTIVKPALERGDIVVSDRSFLSSCAIQWEAQWLGINTVLWINKTAVGKLIPDIILYLDIDIEVALSRTFDADGDKFEKQSKEFYQAIVRGYEKCEKWNKIKDRFFRIDANGSEEEVFERILSKFKIQN
jgi:dTMP kinase